MYKFINTLKALDPTIIIAPVLMFAAGLIVGQQTTSREVKTRYIVDASAVEVIYHDSVPVLEPIDCGPNDIECEEANETAQLAHIDDPSFYSDSVPVLEPIDCGPNDIECEEANKNAGKSAY